MRNAHSFDPKLITGYHSEKDLAERHQAIHKEFFKRGQLHPALRDSELTSTYVYYVGLEERVIYHSSYLSVFMDYWRKVKLGILPLRILPFFGISYAK